MTSKLLKMLFPEKYTCVICDDEVFNKYSICKSCLKSLEYLTGKTCIHCSDPLISMGDYCKRCKGKVFYYDRAIAPFVFDGKIKGIIHGLKYGNKKYLAEPLAIFMADKYTNEKLFADLIIPVPLCSRRLNERGYNQSLLLANAFGKIKKIKVDADAFIRIKETPPQTNLDFMERQSNLVNAFKVFNKKLVKGKSILLIDDVFTTGATATECAKMLKKAGASCVYVLTVAHTNKSQENFD